MPKKSETPQFIHDFMLYATVTTSHKDFDKTPVDQIIAALESRLADIKAHRPNWTEFVNRLSTKPELEAAGASPSKLDAWLLKKSKEGKDDKITEALDDLVHTEAESLASGVNNSGEQIEFLREQGCTDDYILKRLKASLK